MIADLNPPKVSYNSVRNSYMVAYLEFSIFAYNEFCWLRTDPVIQPTANDKVFPYGKFCTLMYF